MNSPKVGVRAGHWSGKDVAKGINPYACAWVGRDARGDLILARQLKSGEWQSLGDADRQAVVTFKQQERRIRGRITISDSAMLASQLLRHARHGPLVRAEIMRRFPLLIVDELQDTGALLSESLLHLVADSNGRALLVGDPDQAIYEFAGARPEMFESFAKHTDASELELSTSQRCPPAVANVASSLKQSGGRLDPAASRSGTAYLVRYENLVPDVAAIARVVRARNPNSVIKVITRLNSTVDLLTGRGRAAIPSLRCRAANRLHRAVQYFRRKKTVTALAAARAAIEQMLIGGEGFTDDEVRSHGVDPRDLRALAVGALLKGNAIALDGTVLDWQLAALGVLESECRSYCDHHGRTLREMKRPARCDGHDDPIADSIADSNAVESDFGAVPVVTVHAVKGETHDVSVFVVPPMTRNSAKRCPSITWWSDSEEDEEERRIAYVALTRSRRDIVLCVDEATYARLVETQPTFVAGFECLTVAQFMGPADGDARAGHHALEFVSSLSPQSATAVV